MQLSTEPAMRGRVMALRVGVALGGTPIGAPIVGWVADHFGPRWALGVGAASGFAAALVGVYALMRGVRADGEGEVISDGTSSGDDLPEGWRLRSLSEFRYPGPNGKQRQQLSDGRSVGASLRNIDRPK